VEILNRYDKKLVEKLSLDPIQLNCWGVTFVAPNLDELSIPFRNKPKKTDEAREIAPGFISKRIDFDNFLIQEVKTHSRLYNFWKAWIFPVSKKQKMDISALPRMEKLLSIQN
jgi:hypothetical protein